MKNTKERDKAISYLKESVKPGSTVYTVLRHVSKSGMYRAIDCYFIENNKPLRISWNVATALGERYDRRHEAIGVTGCGMDIGHHIVYNLSCVLFCPKTYDHDSAYSLNHQWL